MFKEKITAKKKNQFNNLKEEKKLTRLARQALKPKKGALIGRLVREQKN